MSFLSEWAARLLKVTGEGLVVRTVLPEIPFSFLLWSLILEPFLLPCEQCLRWPLEVGTCPHSPRWIIPYRARVNVTSVSHCEIWADFVGWLRDERSPINTHIYMPSLGHKSEECDMGEEVGYVITWNLLFFRPGSGRDNQAAGLSGGQKRLKDFYMSLREEMCISWWESNAEMHMSVYVCCLWAHQFILVLKWVWNAFPP